jgi:uncharacterized membrane protein YkvA (DUF1232 family)
LKETTMGRLMALGALWKSGRLALRLARDPRVPLYAKAVLGVAALYAISPLDFIPDWIPVIGQLDDVAALAAAITLFIRLCPPSVVEEHEISLGLRSERTLEGRARPVNPSGDESSFYRRA